ncbi:internal virion protein with endolysin domain [Aquamicrobium phage P14]|uniref:Putative internal virion protein n=1 Tax=Aquamicrobium phage P14 TaxID=1927013 RepID=A0A1L5C085_9CAUD|nr:internal virion protein with endolysin domain [Aquamicrobium phage P14]APL99500.1 putative internal virion protein [Aquamicrobium phage P14]
MDLESLKKLPVAEALRVAGEFAGVSADVMDKIWETESSRGKNMLSPAGAEGHMQLMPATRKTWEQRFGHSINPNDFHEALFTAAHQVRENMRATKGNLEDALRMYNAGTDRSRWDNDETNGYVQKILGEGVLQRRATQTNLDVLTGVAADVRATMPRAAGEKEYISDVRKAIGVQAGFQEAANLFVSGADVSLEQVAAASEAGRKVADTIVETIVQEPAPDTSFRVTRDLAVDAAQVAVSNEQRKQEITAGQKLTAAFQEVTGTAALMRMAERSEFPVDQEYVDSYMQNIDKIEAGYLSDEIDQIREARSQEHEDYIKAQIARSRENNRKIFSGGAASGLMYSLASGVADPVGWAAGLGVAKSVQLLGLSARALAAEGRILSGAGLIGAEGAAGNVLVDAAIHASGEHVTLNDYALSAGSGFLLGTALSPLGLRAGQKVHTEAEFLRIQKEAARYEADLWARAQDEAGPGASPEKIKAAADRIQVQDAAEDFRIALADVPDSERFLGFVRDEAESPPVVSTPADIQRLGIDTMVADPEQQRLLAEVFVRAERFTSENPVNEAAVSSLGLNKLGLESVGVRLIASPNPVARMVAQTLMESTTGAGGRRRTASLQAYLRERVYVGDTLNQYESIYKRYRARHGANWMGDMTNGKVRDAFDKEVARYREAVANARDGVPRPEYIAGISEEAKAASRVLDRGYNLMRKEMQTVGTVGSSRLGDTSDGYMSHQISAARVLTMTDSERVAVQKVLSRQFQQFEGFDKEFSDRLAVQYLERARDRAYGMHPVPVNLVNPHAGDIVQDALTALKIPEEEINRIMGRYSRGGAGFTKHRLDLDLLEEFDNGAGGKFKLLDLFNYDQMGMYRSYARRAASEVALAQYGVMSKSGLDLLKKAMTLGPEGRRATPKELEAFDQWASEMLNTPYGTHLGKWMDNTLVLTRLARLGGMGFTQLGELANGIATLGVQNSLRVIPALPRLLREVGQFKKGGKPANPILESIEAVGGPLGSDSYRMIGIYDVRDNAVQVYGREELTVVDRAIRGLGNAHAVATGHRAIAAAHQRGMSEQIVMKAMRFIRDGKEDKALADMGFSPDLIQRVKTELPTIATFDSRGNLETLDIRKLSNPGDALEFVTAVHRGANQIIQRTFPGETGKWAHNGFLKMLTQFRTFGITSMEKQVVRQTATVGAAKAFGTLVGAMSFALPIHLARIQLNAAGMSRKEREEYIERMTSPIVLGKAVLNYVSMSGLLSDILDLGTSAVDTVTGGALGDLGINPRGARAGGVVAGQVPAVGWIEDVFSGNPHKTLKALPFGNLPYLMPLVNQFK